MAADAFLITGADSLSQLHKAPYESEDLLQTLLADHPVLLKEIGGTAGRLLLIRREAPVSDGLGSRWSLDHLFVDADGVPVLVEVKRASDSRIRREVVGQMLDYAANGVSYWPIETLIDAFGATARAAGADVDTTLATFLNGADSETFWKQVESNLRSGRVRLVFVADIIPRELRRIVEFLNEQMRPAEVLALEIEQYMAAGGQRVLMPRVVGKTERAVTTKTVSPSGPPMELDEWLAALREKWGEQPEQTARDIIKWAEESGLEVSVTTSGDAVALSVPQANGKPAWPFFIRRSTAKLETSLQYLQHTGAYKDESARLSLLDQFRAIPGVGITTSKATGWPSMSLVEAEKADVWKAWVAIADQIKLLLQRS